MGWFSDLKISRKLVLGFFVVIICTVLSGLVGYRGMRSMDEALDGIYTRNMQSLLLTNQLYVDVLHHYRRIYRHASSSDSVVKETVALQTARNERSIILTIQKYRQIQLDTRETELVTRFESLWPEYISVKERIFRLSDKRNIADAERVLEGEGRDLFKRLDDILNQLIALEMANAKQGRERSSSLFHTYIGLFMFLTLASILLGVVMSFRITASVVTPLNSVLDILHGMSDSSNEKARLAGAIAGGDLSQDLPATPRIQIDECVARDEIGHLLRTVGTLDEAQASLDTAFRSMTASLRENRRAEERINWIKNGQNELNVLLQGEQRLEELADKTLSFIARYLSCGNGAFYLFDPVSRELTLLATYAYTRRLKRLSPGEGIAGQAVREGEMILLSEVPAEYFPIGSSLGESVPSHVLALPLLHDRQVMGVIELGSFTPFGREEEELLQRIGESLAIGLGVNLSRQRVNELLEQTQEQTEELRVQQEELQQTNEELEERAQMLEQQREQIRTKNREVEDANREIRTRADELERVSAYKSEFLANMSHELRTPLNSLLILSRLLMDNREGNLSHKQIDYARTMNDAGNDLLNLINDILDLSKVEAGRLEFHYENLSVGELIEPLRTMFAPLAEQKGLVFKISTTPTLPERLTLDHQRVRQILKNLLSNAFKFTARGAVELSLAVVPAGVSPLGGESLLFSVTDSGIGIPSEKRELIFTAFQQGDGSTSRRFGGTGLGLSISRQLARGMEGEITVASAEGEGSTFAFFLPLIRVHAPGEPKPDSPAPVFVPAEPVGEAPEAGVAVVSVPADDREQFRHGEHSILVIEDDPTFAAILVEMVRERGFLALAAGNGEEGLCLADRHLPSAIILDVMLPHLDGWGVMRLLKENPRTRHIPVHFLTCLEDRQKALAMGAIGFVTKPVDPEQLSGVFNTIEAAVSHSLKRLLIVEDDRTEAESLVALLEGRDVSISVAGSGQEAIGLLSSGSYDCMVLDLGLSDMSGFELLEYVQKQAEGVRLPVIIHSGRNLSHEEEVRLRHFTESIIIKGAKSPERLLNEVTLFLHQVESTLNPEKQRMLRSSLDRDTMLEGKKVLLVDDDMRNIFSLSSALADQQMVVVEAENGKEAIARLEEHPDVDLVLMDIMMPEMDGYEAIRTIRRDPRLRGLHIIAMTAKALKGDQEKCIEAGANDYIAKPIEVDKLLSLMRVWLYQQV